MSLFGSPHDYDSNFLEGHVTNIDPSKYTCTVRTYKNQYLHDVAWPLSNGGSNRSGMYLTPELGDRVLVTTITSYPQILAFLPQAGIPSSNSISLIDSSFQTIDLGTFSNLKNGYAFSADRPKDLVSGDKVLVGKKGNLVAVLSSGGVIARASQAAQIILSRFNDLVRIVARNYQTFTDVSSDSYMNVRNRIFKYLGIDNELARSRVGDYKYVEILGDVAAGEFFGPEPDVTQTPPDIGPSIRKHILTLDDGTVVMTEILQLTGEIIVTVQSGANNAVTDQTNGKWSSTVTADTFSSITILPGSVTVNYNNIDTVTLDSNGIKLDHNNAAITIMDDSGIRSDFSGHFVHIDSSGTHLG